MAEQEVIKHTKKVFKIWGNKKVSVWHKVREFLLEIAIIVFAISLSIWVHDKSEHSHQQKEVKEFLLGLREDLQADVAEMKEDKESYVMQGKTFSYITSLAPGKSLNNDSLKKYQTWLFNITRLQENNGRFEGFKAAGKIGAIEDLVIQNNIMDLYQENIPAVLASTDAYIRWKNKLLDFSAKNRKRTSDSTNNIPVMLLTDEAQNLCGFMANPSEIIERYDSCIAKMNSLLKEIGDRYGLDKHQ